MKIRFAWLISIALSLFMGVQAAYADDFVIPYDGAFRSKPGVMEVVFRDSQSQYLESTAPNKVGDPYNAVFPACALKTARNCIESVDFRISGGEWQTGKLSDYVQTGMDGQIDGIDENGSKYRFNNFPEDKKSATPAGGKASTWVLEGANHEGGNEYIVSATFNSSTHFSINLAPIRWEEPITWAWEGNDVTTRKYTNFEFPTDVEYRVKLHLGVVATRVNPWFFGRLTSPNIDVVGDLLTISGHPGYSSAAASDYFSCGNSIITQAEKKGLIAGSGCSYRIYSPQYDKNSFAAFKYFEEYMHQWKYESAWSLDSQDSINPNAASTYQIQKQCGVTGIAGLSVTNALIMQNNVPIWDPNSKEFSYQIASTHLDANGQPNVGNLELALSSKLAKCLWGATTLTGSQAKVSITNENGAQTVATSQTAVNNEWINLKVSNFSFSTPKISMSLLIPDSAKLKKTISIKCIKGKQTKLISGISPKCPAGFKQA